MTDIGLFYGLVLAVLAHAMTSDFCSLDASDYNFLGSIGFSIEPGGFRIREKTAPSDGFVIKQVDSESESSGGEEDIRSEPAGPEHRNSGFRIFEACSSSRPDTGVGAEGFRIASPAANAGFAIHTQDNKATGSQHGFAVSSHAVLSPPRQVSMGNCEPTSGFQVPHVVATAMPECCDYHEPTKWCVGRDCGTWIGSHTELNEQASVLLTNTIWNFRQLSDALLKRTAEAIGHVQNRVVSSKHGLAHAVSSAFLGVSTHRCESTFNAVKKSGWVIREEPGSASASQDTCVSNSAPSQGMSQRSVLTYLTRETLAGCVEGMSIQHVLRAIARARLAGITVGDKFHSSRFLRDVEHLGMQCAQAGLAISLDSRLPGLGNKKSSCNLFRQGCDPRRHIQSARGAHADWYIVFGSTVGKHPVQNDCLPW